jgi:hypothetical protein
MAANVAQRHLLERRPLLGHLPQSSSASRFTAGAFASAGAQAALPL